MQFTKKQEPLKTAPNVVGSLVDRAKNKSKKFWAVVGASALVIIVGASAVGYGLWTNRDNASAGEIVNKGGYDFTFAGNEPKRYSFAPADVSKQSGGVYAIPRQDYLDNNIRLVIKINKFFDNPSQYNKGGFGVAFEAVQPAGSSVVIHAANTFPELHGGKYCTEYVLSVGVTEQKYRLPLCDNRLDNGTTVGSPTDTNSYADFGYRGNNPSAPQLYLATKGTYNGGGTGGNNGTGDVQPGTWQGYDVNVSQATDPDLKKHSTVGDLSKETYLISKAEFNAKGAINQNNVYRVTKLYNSQNGADFGLAITSLTGRVINAYPKANTFSLNGRSCMAYILSVGSENESYRFAYCYDSNSNIGLAPVEYMYVPDQGYNWATQLIFATKGSGSNGGGTGGTTGNADYNKDITSTPTKSGLTARTSGAVFEKRYTVGNLATEEVYAVLKDDYLNKPELGIKIRLTGIWADSTPIQPGETSGVAGPKFNLQYWLQQSSEKVNRFENNRGADKYFTFVDNGRKCIAYIVVMENNGYKYLLPYCDNRATGLPNEIMSPVQFSWSDVENSSLLTQEERNIPQLIIVTKSGSTGSSSSSSSTTSQQRLYYALDNASCDTLVGWVADRQYPNRQLEVIAEIDGQQVNFGGQKFTDVARPDVTNYLKTNVAFPTNTGATNGDKFGFNLALPAAVKTAGTKNVKVYAYYRQSDGVVSLPKTEIGSKTITCTGTPSSSSSTPTNSSSTSNNNTGNLKMGIISQPGTDKAHANAWVSSPTNTRANAYAVFLDDVNNNATTTRGCEIRTFYPVLVFANNTNCAIIDGPKTIVASTNPASGQLNGRYCVEYLIRAYNQESSLAICFDGNGYHAMSPLAFNTYQSNYPNKVRMTLGTKAS